METAYTSIGLFYSPKYAVLTNGKKYNQIYLLLQLSRL